MNFEISNNICEICRQKATAGILDETKQIKIRYSCQDHYLQVYEKIKENPTYRDIFNNSIKIMR